MFRASCLTVGEPGTNKQVFGVGGFLEALFKGVFVAQPLMFCRFYANERENASGCLVPGYVMLL